MAPVRPQSSTQDYRLDALDGRVLAHDAELQRHHDKLDALDLRVSRMETSRSTAMDLFKSYVLPVLLVLLTAYLTLKIGVK